MTAAVYTTPAAPDSVRVKASRSKWWLIGFGIVLALVVLIAATSRPTDYRQLSIDNPTDSGARAVAQILGDQGISVRQYESLASIYMADASTTTLVIAGGGYLTDAQITSVLRHRGDVVFIGASDQLVQALDAGLGMSYDFLPEGVQADCDDPDAIAAEEVRVEWAGIVTTGPTEAELCFGGRSNAYAMAVVDTDLGKRTVVANEDVYLNSTLTTWGNAALALRTTGHHENVAWYLGNFTDPTLLGGEGQKPDVDITPDFLPPGFGTALYALGLAALVGALWKGRRFGPLAVEPLPVVVRASEATRGRARLYRRARAYGRATAALRAASARRMGSRIGVPRSAGRDAMVGALERATGRAAPEIARVLYGPPPTTEAQMIAILDQLDALEGEVHNQ